MRKFSGFKPGKVRHIKLPAPLFSDLLPLIDDLAELHVTLFSFWALSQKDGNFRYLRQRDFVNSTTLMDSLSAAAPDTSPETTLNQALKQAVKRGTLLRAEVEIEGRNEALYFVNSATGRTAIESIQADHWQPGDAHNPVEILPERPNIYQLYEANIGAITPMIADELKDAETEFPGFWLQEAVQLAVEHNKRNWRYIRAILDRWDREGRDRGFTGGPAQQKGQKYISGRYAAFINNDPDK
jgi:DnaD/phage-associated family protein